MSGFFVYTAYTFRAENQNFMTFVNVNRKFLQPYTHVRTRVCVRARAYVYIYIYFCLHLFTRLHARVARV